MPIAPHSRGGNVMLSTLIAIEVGTYLSAAVVVLVLFGILLIPYLIKEIRQGKGELGPVRHLGPHGKVTLGPPAPTGVGDNNPGRRGAPAPGMPDGQPDP